MLNITLLDGKKLQFPGKVNGHEIAKTISPSLAKKALVIKVNDSFKDLSSFIEKDSTVQIITIEDDYGLEVIRHDTAHVLAMAVQELFKDTQVTIGPVIENGFYYDFSRKKPFTDEDLVKIEEYDIVGKFKDSNKYMLVNVINFIEKLDFIYLKEYLKKLEKITRKEKVKYLINLKNKLENCHAPQ